MYLFKMGLKSLIYRKKQYIALFLVCMVGVGISLSCIFLVKGMLAALEDKARLYYGGDINFIGGGLGKLSFDYVEDFVQKLKPVFPEGSVVSPRFDYDADYSSFYFEGNEVRQRVIKGVDFCQEMELFAGFNYLAGSSINMAGSNGVLLSEPIARMLGVKVGDTITFLLHTVKGYTNTVQLEVHGIFRDSSLFGMYTSYMDLDFLRQSYGVPGHWANRICISLPEGYKLSSSKLKEFQSQSEQIFPMYPLVSDKEIFYEAHEKFTEPLYALIELYANLDDLKILIDAMNIITSFVIFTLLIIIVVGVSTTYRVIVMKRINEIGIYKAIGMRRNDVFKVLLSETSVLIVIGCILGVIFSFGVSIVIQTIDFSFIPAFDVFLVNGSLLPRWDFLQILLVSIAVYVTTTCAVLFSVQKSVKTTPVEALGVTE